MNNGWSTPTAATPYANWIYREYNKSADKMCNAVMNQAISIFHHTEGKAPREDNTHIFGQSDGGCRFKGNSATGYSIRTCNTHSNTTTVITTGGSYIDTNMSSLTVEAHALDELADRITQWMQGTSKQYTSTTNTYTTTTQTTQTQHEYKTTYSH